MQYAIIDAGRVTNIIEADAEFAARIGAIDASGGAIGDLWDGEVFTPPAGPPIADRQSAAWERIKAERERRKVLGVLAGGHWFHSDADSRIQQLSLFVMGAAVPAISWKTLTLSGAPVFVTMTQTLAGAIFQATASSDAAIFGAAEAHRVSMEASSTPGAYDFSTGWPAGFGDV
jgi:hypothetical protein